MVDEAKPEHPLPRRRPLFNRHQLLMQVVVAGVILVSGVGIGAGGSILALKGRIIPRIRVMPTDPPGPEPNAIAVRWKGKYGLSDKQEQQAKDILTKQFTTLREIRQKLFQAEQSEREKAAASLKKVLDPEQYAKWDEDMKRMAGWFEHMRPRGPRGDRKGPPRGDRGSGWPRDPNGRRWDGPPRPPMEGDMRRGDWPPRPPMGPDGQRGAWPPNPSMDANRPPDDRPPDQAAETGNHPGEMNVPQ
jgi:hypothetical protein